MAHPLYPIAFVGQKAPRLGEHLRVHKREYSRVVPSLQFLTGPERVFENEDRVLAVAMKLAVRICELVCGDQSCRECWAYGFEFLG
jgi:hypothetical protein